MRVTIDKPTLISIHSLSVGASKDDVTPVITQIALQREGDALRAVATDRFMVVAGLYTKNIYFENWEDGEILLVDPKSLKTVVDIKKAEKYGPPLDIVKDEETGRVSAIMNSSTQVDIGSLSHLTFPPVMKLFPREQDANGATLLSVRPDFIARLAKLLPPEVRPDKNQAWHFEFRSIDGESKKPEPIYAKYPTKDDYVLEALIQPALIKY